MQRRELLKGAVAAASAFTAQQSKATQGELKQATYAIVEMMGYKRLAGRLSQAPVPGLLQLDIPVEGGFITQFINPASIYRVTVCDELSVKQLSKETDPLPAICIEDSGMRQMGLQVDEQDYERPF